MPQLNTGAWPPEAEMLGKKLACWLDAPGNPQQSTWLSTQKPRVFSWMSMILGMSDDYWDSWSYPITSFLNLIPSFHLNILWPLELNGCWPLSGVPSPFNPSGNLETWLGLGEDLLWVALFFIYIYIYMYFQWQTVSLPEGSPDGHLPVVRRCEASFGLFGLFGLFGCRSRWAPWRKGTSIHYSRFILIRPLYSLFIIHSSLWKLGYVFRNI